MQQEGKSIISAIILWILVIVISCIQLCGFCFSMITNTSYIDALLSETNSWDKAVEVIKAFITSDLPNGKRSLPYLHNAITPEWLSKQVLLVFNDVKAYVANPTPHNVPSILFYELKNRLGEQLENGTDDERQAFAEFCLAPLPDHASWLDFSSIESLNKLSQFYKTSIRLLVGLVGLCTVLCLILCWLQQWDKHECIMWIGAISLGIGLISLLSCGCIYFVQSKLSIIHHLEKMAEGIGFSAVLVRQLLQKAVNDLLIKMMTISMAEVFLGAVLISISKVDYKAKLVIIK